MSKFTPITIAIPVAHGRLLAHLGAAGEFALVEANPQTRAIRRSQTIPAPPHEPGSFPRWLRERGIQVLIVSHSGIGQRALDNLIHHHLEVRAGPPGATVESLVAEHLTGQLPAAREGCQHQHAPHRLSRSTPAKHECRLRLE